MLMSTGCRQWLKANVAPECDKYNTYMVEASRGRTNFGYGQKQLFSFGAEW